MMNQRTRNNRRCRRMGIATVFSDTEKRGVETLDEEKRIVSYVAKSSEKLLQASNKHIDGVPKQKN